MKKIGFVGPVATRSGYGAHARDILSSLLKMNKYDIQVISLPWGSTPMDALENEDALSKQIKSRIVQNFTEQPDIFIQVSIPNEFQKVGRFNIGITAGIETTLCAPKWIEGCNRMDLIITTSQHSKKVFEDMVFDNVDNQTQQKIGELRCTTPIEVLIEGSDLSTYFKVEDGTGSKSVTDMMSQVTEKFAFLHVGHWIQGGVGADRKDISMLVHTFCSAFKGVKNAPALILKTSGATFSIIDREQCITKIQQMRDNIGEDVPNVYLLHGDLTDEEMNFLYNHSKIKAMISFTHGEGYGRPLQEFALTGKPVIASGWSGHLDFLLATHHTLLPGGLTQVDKSAVNDWILPESKWFTVNYPYAANVMRHIVENYKKYAEKSERGRLYIKNNFSIEAMDTAFASIMEQYDNKMPQAVKIQMPKLNLPKLQKV